MFNGSKDRLLRLVVSWSESFNQSDEVAKSVIQSKASLIEVKQTRR
jgi:hypothetical protein